MSSPAVERFVDSFEEDLERDDPHCDTTEEQLEEALESEFENSAVTGLRSPKNEEHSSLKGAGDAGWLTSLSAYQTIGLRSALGSLTSIQR